MSPFVKCKNILNTISPLVTQQCSCEVMTWIKFTYLSFELCFDSRELDTKARSYVVQWPNKLIGDAPVCQPMG